MPLTATKAQAGYVIGVSDETVDKLLRLRKLQRIPLLWAVRIKLDSIASYLGVPIDYVAQECLRAPATISYRKKGPPKKSATQLELFLPPTAAPDKKPKLPNKHSHWPKARKRGADDDGHPGSQVPPTSPRPQA